MITKIKFKTAPATPSVSLLETAANSPLVLDVASLRAGGEKSSTTTRIRLGRGQQDFATLEFVGSSSAAPRLVSVEGNLPALLYGHNDRMIGSQADLELALTRLRWLALPYVDPCDSSLILPGLQPRNTGSIEALGLALQVDDPDQLLFMSANNSRVEWSTEEPIMTVGSVTRLLGTGVIWTISELALGRGNGEIIPTGCSCTRLEVLIEGSWRISCGASVRHPFARNVASLPFAKLYNIYRDAAMSTLSGGLGCCQSKAAVKDFDLASRVLKFSHNPVAFRLALKIEQSLWTREKTESKLKEVFSALQLPSQISFGALLGDSPPLHFLRDIMRADVEASHAAAVYKFGFPVQPDSDISGLFSGVLTLNRKDLSRRYFTNN